jgi:hypothetical protein
MSAGEKPHVYDHVLVRYVTTAVRTQPLSVAQRSYPRAKISYHVGPRGQ